jgi:hypothetical protein
MIRLFPVSAGPELTCYWANASLSDRSTDIRITRLTVLPILRDRESCMNAAPKEVIVSNYRGSGGNLVMYNESGSFLLLMEQMQQSLENRRMYDPSTSVLHFHKRKKSS